MDALNRALFNLSCLIETSAAMGERLHNACQLDPSPTQHSRRQKQHRANQRKHRVHGHAEESQR